MYSYTSATLAIRAKCSLSYYYLSLPRDQQHCCHCRCCNFPTNTLFPISSCILSRNLLGQYFKVPSRTLLHVGSRRPRDFSRSCNSEMMELLVKAEERLSDSEQLDRKSVRREVEIKSVEGKRQSSIKEGKTGGSLSTRSEGLNSTVTSSSTLLRDLELNRTRRRRASVESLVGYGNKKRGTKFYSHNVAAEEAPEVHKHVDDSWRGRRYSSNEDVLLDSTKGGYMKENVRSRQLGVKNEHVHVKQQSNLSQQVSNWENRSHRSSEKASRKLEAWSDDLKNAAVSANVKKNEKGESSASEARQSSSMDRVVRHDELRRSQDKESKLSDFHYSDVQNATYAQRDFHVTNVSEREDKNYLKQNSAQLIRDNRIHLDQKAVEKYESTSSNQKLSEVSVLNDSDFVNSSRVDEKSLQGIKLRSNLVQDSGQVFGEEMTRMVLERPLENKLEEWEVKLSMEGNSIQVGRSGGKQFGRRELQHHDFSEVHSSNVETSSLLKGRITGMTSKYNSVQSSSPATNDIGVQVQVEMDDAMFNAGVESQREPNEFDVTRRNTRRISILQQENKSKTEKKKETSSVKTSASLTQEEMQRSSLTIDRSNSASIQMTSAGGFDGISISQPTHNELNVQTGTDSVHQMQNNSTESASNLVKSSASHGKKICKKIADLDESGRKHLFSSGIQIGEPGRGKMQSTFKTEDRKEIFSTELTQERKEKVSNLFLEEGSESKTTEMASTSFPSSLKSHSEVDSDSRTAAENKFKGPSDEMWDVQGTFSSKASITEEPEEELPTSGAIALTIPAPTFSKETAMTRRSPKSLWSYVTDIIRMSWILRGHSHGSTLGSDKRASSEESLSSEAWFSGHEPDEAVAGDETQHEEIISLPTNSGPLKGSVDFFFEKGKNGDRLATTDLMKKDLSAESHSSSEEANLKVDAKSSHDILSSVAIVEQRLISKADTASPFTLGIVDSSVRDKVKMLKPCLSYPVAVKKVGFSSSITQATDAAQMEASLLMEDSNSGLDYFREPSIPTVDSTLPIVTEIVEVDKSESSIPKLELEPFREILPEVHGYKEPEIKQRKFSRNKQVLKEHFDGWEEAYKLENEQKKLDEFYMREAILEAKKGADTWEVPVGAVLVQNGKIIARGCNMVEELRDSTAHAEMICIRDASNLLRTWRLAESTLYVTLEPCAMCAGAILQARVDSVVWGAPNKLLGADGSWVRLFPGEIGESGYIDPPRQDPGPVHPFHPKIKVRRGVLETECGEVMQQFFKLRRKKDKKPDPSPPACLPITNKPTKFFSKLHNIFSLMFCL